MAIRRAVSAFGRLMGAADSALSVPSLDGAFKPNSFLDDARIRARCKSPDNLMRAGDEVYFSSATTMLSLSPDGRIEQHHEGRGEITALAGLSDGTIAIARSGEGVTLIAPSGKEKRLSQLQASLGDVTSITFVSGDCIAVSIGARGLRADQWQTDLMLRGRSGSIWTIDTSGQATKRADNLAYPYGVVADSHGDLVISTAWDSALVRLDAADSARPVLENLPGYPSRLIQSAKGGFWLAIFAPRNQLVELVLRETAFRNRMMAEIEPGQWICPSLRPKDGPIDPMQEGAQKIGGTVKPWAPAFSYGLIVELDEDLLPVRGFHSRANGHRHGITSLLEVDDSLLACSRGGDAIVEIPTDRVF